MSQETVLVDLFNRWERVWHDGQYDLIPACVGATYIRHDEAGDRRVTREAYAAEIAKIRQERPDLRVVVNDHLFRGDRAWFRFAFKWTDPKTGEPRSRAGMQSYRIEAGKLAETWLILQPLGSRWTGALAQEHWTGRAPISDAWSFEWAPAAHPYRPTVRWNEEMIPRDFNSSSSSRNATITLDDPRFSRRSFFAAPTVRVRTVPTRDQVPRTVPGGAG
jgi:hypothetical protein